MNAMLDPVPQSAPLHVAIIMDGNGRWAESRGLPRVAGHRAGARSVRRVVEAAPDLGIGTLTLYTFSVDNWRRPAAEVRALFGLLRETLARETRELADNGVRLRAIGRRDRLSRPVLEAVERSERATASGTRLELRLALDYSARDAIVEAARALAGAGEWTRDGFARSLAGAIHAGDGTPEVDLLVRTGGEQRLSDFLLWECAYAELHFTPVCWPDFGEAELTAALREFHARDRRFGGLGSESGPRATGDAGLL
jgi:undecaprenyl diphosphate synthase